MRHVSFFRSIMPVMQTSVQSRFDGAADYRIGVTVLTGFLGSGKTTLLNRLVQDRAYSDAAVIVNEFGEIGVDHHLLRHTDGRIAVIEGGCICCTVNGGLVNTLRDLFMLALRRQVPRFHRVLIETTGLATPAAILFTLRHEYFLAERYAHRGTIVVADAKHIQAQLAEQPEASQQIALADLVICSKPDLVRAPMLADAVDAVRQINPGVPIGVQWPDTPLDERLLAPSLTRSHDSQGDLRGWLARFSPLGGRHSQVRHAVFELSEPVSRAVFLTGMARVQEAHHRSLLRIKGIVGFEGESLPCAIHGVHRDLYPPEPLAVWPEDAHRSWLVFIVRELDPGALVQALRASLLQPGPESPVPA